MRNVFLKVKAKSLAAEAKIIRKEEKKATSDYIRTELQQHRIVRVRQEARATQLAIAFNKGHPYKRAEAKCKDIELRDGHIAKRIATMVQKYTYKLVTQQDIIR